MASAERVPTADIVAQAAYKRMNLGVVQESLTQRNIRMRVSFLSELVFAKACCCFQKSWRLESKLAVYFLSFVSHLDLSFRSRYQHQFGCKRYQKAIM